MATVLRGGPSLAAVLVFAFGLGGCGLTTAQKTAIGQFSRATAVVGETTSGELAEMRQGVIQANTSTLVIVGQDPVITPATVERQFTIETTSRVGNAARALQTYGQLLHALVEDTQAQELRGAANAFVSNLRAVPGVSVADKEADAITAAVYTIGRVFVERQKARAVNTIVPAAAPHVDTITALLAAEFDPDRDGSLASAFRGAAERVRGESATAFRTATSHADRGLLLTAWQGGRRASLRSEEVHKRSSQAIASIRKAHASLLQALHEDRWTLDDAKGAANEFEREIKVLARLAADLIERSKLLQSIR